MNDPAIRPRRIVPPGSTPLRELAHAIAGALTVPNDLAELGELDYLRGSRDRARVVLFAMRRIIADHDHDLDDDDLMSIVATIRDSTTQLAAADTAAADPFRAFTEAIIAALTISPCPPATTERAYLQSARQRARRVLLACRRAIEGPQIEDADLAAAVKLLSQPSDSDDQAADEPPEMIP
jgi:hypothetical protein